jgi:hypothetical protein
MRSHSPSLRPLKTCPWTFPTNALSRSTPSAHGPSYLCSNRPASKP